MKLQQILEQTIPGLGFELVDIGNYTSQIIRVLLIKRAVLVLRIALMFPII